MRRSAALAITLLVALSSALAAGPSIESARIESKGGKRTYYYFVPQTAATSKAAPVLLLLHGSGHNGRLLVEHWKELADKEGIILVGPDAANPASWSTKNDPPSFLRDVIDDVARKFPVDRQRVYVFGHSAGAKFGLIMAMAESNYFAAAAVHAGLIPPQVQHLITDAERKIPVAIWSGTADRSVPFEEARATADALKSSSFPVEFNALSGHGHNYYEVSAEVNVAAWEFLKDKRNEKPEFKEYN
jgi:poly(3-hydroxybutyrate) depolymerase